MVRIVYYTRARTLTRALTLTLTWSRSVRKLRRSGLTEASRGAQLLALHDQELRLEYLEGALLVAQLAALLLVRVRARARVRVRVGRASRLTLTLTLTLTLALTWRSVFAALYHI